MNLYNQGKFYFLLLLTLMMLGATGVIEAQAQSDLSEKPYLDPRLTAADTLFISRKYADALSAYTAASSVFEQEENWPGYLIAKSGVITTNAELKQAINVKTLYDSLLNFANEKLGPEAPELSYLYLAYGYYLAKIEFEFDEAEVYMLKAFDLTKSSGRVDSPVWIKINHRLTYLYAYNLDDIYVARDYLQTLIDNSDNLSSGTLAFTYYTMASISRQFDDLEKAEIYAIKALEAYSQIPDINLGFAYTVLGNVYQEQQKFEKANDNYDIAVKTLKQDFGSNHSGLIDIYLNQLLNYNTLGQPLTALEIGQEALRVLALNDELNSDNAQLVYLNMGAAYLDNGEYDKALTSTRRSLDLLLNVMEFAVQDDVANSYGVIGSIYVDRQMFDSSMVYFQKALVIADEDLKDKHYSYAPQAEPFLNRRVYHEILSIKASALLRQGEITNDANLLNAALDYYLLVDSLTTYNRMSFEKEGSALLLLEISKNIFEEAIHCTYLLFELTDDQKYLDHAQYFFEASKSRMLFETVNESDQFALLPDSLAQMSRQLAIDYSYQTRLKHEEEQQEETDTVSLISINQRIFDIAQTQELLIVHIAQEYPYVKSSRENLGVIELQEVKDYSEKRQVVEFFWGDSSVYIFGVSRGFVSFREIRIDQSLIKHLENFSLILRTAVPDPFDQQAFNSFHESAYLLYQHLLAPIVQKDQPSMLIIPDGPLNSIPFEALISSPYQNNDINYKALDYLINAYEIGYDHSLSLAFNDQKSPDIIEDPSILALGFSSEKDVEVAKSTRSANIELPGTTQEIAAISEFMTDGEYLLGNDASEAYFIEHGADYDILHLAIHGMGDEQQRLGSKLIFKSSAQGYDSLYAYEMFNMNLQAKLAILSACETGVGKLQKGEGVFNLARGFTYAGCPSVVMSLWKINDAVSAQLMSSFYKDLVKGNNVDKSLRSAKLDYLKGADRFSAHPSQWAAFVHFGAQNSFDIPNKNKWVIWGAVLLGLVILSWTLVRLRKKRNLVIPI